MSDKVSKLGRKDDLEFIGTVNNGMLGPLLQVAILFRG